MGTTCRRLAGAVVALAAVAAAPLAALPAAPPARADSTVSPSRVAADPPIGPPLTVPARRLARALACHGLRHGATAVLLVPGTTLDAAANFSWNYEPLLTASGDAWCGVSPPGEMMADAQTSAEYVVYAIRRMAHVTGRRIDILGYSQGGMLPRWALKYFPDTRAEVDDFVAIDPSNHGTLDADAACALRCAPAIWQQRRTSHFLHALNTGPETWRGISYTVVYSRTDEIVVPNLDASGSSALHTGRGRIANIAVQQVCPADVSDHLAMGSYDPVAAALALDAFTHRGPANAARIPLQVCGEAFMPGVDPTTFPADYAAYLRHVGSVFATAPRTGSEPPLRGYAR